MVLELAEHQVEDKILEVFEEDEIIHFPVRTQKEARSFVKALNSKGVNYNIICEEIGEHEPNFDSWRKSLGRVGIGQRVIEWINQPLNQILESDDDEEEFVENLRQKMRKRSENGSATANDKEELYHKQQLQEQKLKEEREKQREEKKRQEREEQEKREKEIERQQREEKARKEREEREKQEKEERLALEKQREEERERQQRYEAEQKQARELEKKRKEEELHQAELERQRQEQKEDEENQEEVEEGEGDLQQKEEELQEEDNEIIFNIKSVPEEAEDRTMSVQERLQAFEKKSDIFSANHKDSADGSISPEDKESPKANHAPKQNAEHNLDNSTDDDLVDENYNSDLDPDNTNQSPVLATLVKKISAMRSSNKNGPGYIYILSDADESAENKQIKVGISRFPEKRLRQAQIFNPDLWMVKKFSVSKRVSAVNECYDELYEYRISDNATGWFIGTYDEMENIVSEVVEKYPTTKLERQEQEESEC